MPEGLKEEIEKYDKRTDYMIADAVVGTRVGFVRDLIAKVAENRTYAPPDVANVSILLEAAQNKAYPIELRSAINNLLANISDLQGQIRGMRIEEARSKELSDANAG